MRYALCGYEMKAPADLQDKLDTLPSGYGVYLMKDAKGNILYVGKEKDLRKRVLSYFRDKEHQSPKPGYWFPRSRIWNSSLPVQRKRH